MAIKVVYQAADHTLTDDEIQNLHQKTVEACKLQLGADLRSA
jgi:phenylalanyl-tRNA synthetase beta subunit